MQITIPQPALSRELSLLAGVAGKKSTIPILSTIRMEAGDGLTLTATDMECGLTVHVPCEVKSRGAICLPAKRFGDYVRALSGDVGIKTDDKQYVTITAGRSRSRIPGMSVESFPELPPAPEVTNSIDARVFARQLARVSHAISMEASRFTLDGALVEFSDSTLRCVASDGHRLAYAESHAATGTKTQFLMPRAVIALFAKLADSAEGGALVDIATDDNHLFFAIGPRRIIARKMTGNFPDYKRVLPNHDRHVTADRAELMSALERVGQFADERSRCVKIAFSDGEIRVSSNSVDAGESDESLPCGDSVDLEIGFNCQYIIDALRAIDHPKVAVFLKDAKSAAEIRPMTGAGTEQDPYRVGEGYRCVVMPMRV